MTFRQGTDLDRPRAVTNFACTSFDGKDRRRWEARDTSAFKFCLEIGRGSTMHLDALDRDAIEENVYGVTFRGSPIQETMNSKATVAYPSVESAPSQEPSIFERPPLAKSNSYLGEWVFSPGTSSTKMRSLDEDL
jgi:hypothetical protein